MIQAEGMSCGNPKSKRKHDYLENRKQFMNSEYRF